MFEVLYGPPGTGKTTFAEYLAAMLGWELITFSPSDFLERGDQGVEARAKVIFTALQELSDKVILFDEIDQLILDKKSTEWQRQEGMFKFMTPSMLVKLRTLRRAAKSIFIIATNYEYMIEPAAKRHGRIDDRILVLPPDKRYRQIFLAEQLRNRGWSKPNSGLWKQAIEKSALYTFPGLNDALTNSFDNSKTGKEAIAKFIKFIDEHPPEINPNAYLSPFGFEIENGEARRKSEEQPSQVPLEEFRYVWEIAQENPASAGFSKIAKVLIATAPHPVSQNATNKSL